METYKNSDAMIILPGGFGSLYEFFTANYCGICEKNNVPIIIYNSCGYYDKLIEFINEIKNKKFINKNEIGKFVVADNSDEVMKYLKNFL